jgi:hypothetical protein
MNKNIKNLYSCTLNNKVIVIETNFSKFYKALKLVEPNCGYDKLYIKKFKEVSGFERVINDKVYYFQSLV